MNQIHNLDYSERQKKIDSVNEKKEKKCEVLDRLLIYKPIINIYSNPFSYQMQFKIFKFTMFIILIYIVMHVTSEQLTQLQENYFNCLDSNQNAWYKKECKKPSYWTVSFI